jgi:hypothetical protein
MHLMRGSAGFAAGPDGLPVGRMVPTVAVTVTVGGTSGDFNNDGTIDAVDIDLLCQELHADDPRLAFDLTGDGVVDSMDRDNLILDKLQTDYGDSNLDGRFNSSDLVAVFTQGEYEDQTPGNSGWADGDWDCDGDFGTSDLVLAFQGGGYSANAVDPVWADLAAAWEGRPLRRARV